MTLKTVWYDTNGRVKCVDSADSPAVIHGADKATADTDVVGEITLRHRVMVVDGVVTEAVHDPVLPDPEVVKRRQELARIPELRESILDQIAAGETPDPDKRAEYKRLRQKHPRIAGEESAPLSDGAFTR